LVIQDTLSAHNEAARTIRPGGVVAFRTDTFYGLGVDPLNATAVRKLRELKGREDNKPILLIISDYAQVDRFIQNPSSTFKAVANRFWPGPITLIGVAHPQLPVELTAGTKTIGVRLPDDDSVRSLVRTCGGALTATSANTSGNPPATSAADVERYFGDRIDLILDGGVVTATQPSTVLDLSIQPPRLIREGAVLRESLVDYL
jgi:L-threonylcarbamoyladenylate synthase